VCLRMTLRSSRSFWGIEISNGFTSMVDLFGRVVYGLDILTKWVIVSEWICPDWRLVSRT